MARRGIRQLEQQLASQALLVGRHALGESDWLVHLFTERLGALKAVARGARRSKKRFAALEPMHQLQVRVSVSPTRELAILREAQLERPRLVLTSSLAAMEAAGQGLRWVRRCAPHREAEPAQWTLINGLLDSLDTPVDDGEEGELRAQKLLAAFGMQLLTVAGWQLELQACVMCRTEVPPRSRVLVDVHAGGVVCRHCGGITGVELGWQQLQAMRRPLDRGFANCAEARRCNALVDATIAVHGESR